ncbi:unnamed protein product [Musa acuminata var. zebrina]
MPKNKGKGGKNRKRGKNEADDEKRELVFKEDGQEYAQVLRMLGNGRCEAMCIDGSKRLCHIRGKMHKKVWIAAGDIILVGLRDYQDDKADVIFKYMPDEARLLKAYGELPENTRLNEGIGGLDEEEEGAADDYIDNLLGCSGGFAMSLGRPAGGVRIDSDMQLLQPREVLCGKMNILACQIMVG